MKKEKKHIRLVDYDREIHDHITHLDFISVFLLFGPNFKVDKVGQRVEASVRRYFSNVTSHKASESFSLLQRLASLN